MRLIIEESEKEGILSKYKDNTSDRLLTYLRRNYPIYMRSFPKYNVNDDDFKTIEIPSIVINDKIVFVEDNKKRIVNKIFYDLEGEFSDISIDTKRRTIKKYVDMVLVTKSDGE